MVPTEDEVLLAIRVVDGPWGGARSEQTLDELGADSLDRVELAMALEGQFDIEIEDDVVEGWGAAETTIGGIVALVIEKTAVN